MFCKIDVENKIRSVCTANIDGFTEVVCDSFPSDYWNYEIIDGEFKLLPYFTHKYFLIPSDFVPNIGNYSGFVKEAHFHLSFNVRVNEVATVVEGIDVSSPLFINFIPCSCTRWTDEGLQLLEAVIDYWNSSNPLKQITFEVKFESYNDLITFRNSNTL